MKWFGSNTKFRIGPCSVITIPHDRPPPTISSHSPTTLTPLHNTFRCISGFFAFVSDFFACVDEIFGCVQRIFACVRNFFACVRNIFGCVKRFFGCVSGIFASKKNFFGCVRENFGCVRNFFACVKNFLGCKKMDSSENPFSSFPQNRVNSPWNPTRIEVKIYPRKTKIWTFLKKISHPQKGVENLLCKMLRIIA